MPVNARLNLTRMQSSKLNVVLLAAGRGSRIAELTTHTHKSLLPIAGRPCIGHIMDALLENPVGDIALVTGYMDYKIRNFVGSHYDDERIKVVHNPDFDRDTNIRSVDIGVESLSHPEEGYVIIETDIVVEPEGWRVILSIDPDGHSLWLTRGSYSRDLTGGALRVDDEQNVAEMVYAPAYDLAYEGWQKLLGVVFVGKGQASTDRALRKEAIRETMRQYYMTPWCSNLAKLPCKGYSLGSRFAHSFNNLDSYRSINAQYEALIGGAAP